jgi:alkanesulfonate monooxygenase SsuD/methylene tetrahydromethanopterin reductase-like flavin-dependent oxidoreductase (luciferase family)
VGLHAFDPAAHHPSWLAKRAVTVDHLSGGRLDLRLAVGADGAAARAAWECHGIRYPGGAARVAALDEALGLLVAARGWRLARCSGPGRRSGSPPWGRARWPQRPPGRKREASYVTPADSAARSARLDGLLTAAGRRPGGHPPLGGDRRDPGGVP